MGLMDVFEGNCKPEDFVEELSDECKEIMDIVSRARCDMSDMGNDLIQIHRELFADFGEKVTPQRGSLVYARLDNSIVHTGIYLGDNRIIDQVTIGKARVVSPYQFCKFKNNEPVQKIYCLTNRKGEILYNEDIAKCAESKLIESEGQQINTTTSHQFCLSCITETYADKKTFSDLVKLISTKYLVVSKIKWKLAKLDFEFEPIL